MCIVYFNKKYQATPEFFSRFGHDGNTRFEKCEKLLLFIDCFSPGERDYYLLLSVVIMVNADQSDVDNCGNLDLENCVEIPTAFLSLIREISLGKIDKPKRFEDFQPFSSGRFLEIQMMPLKTFCNLLIAP